MKKPTTKTRHYVDWVEYQRYLETEHDVDYRKYRDALWEWFCDTHNFRNGCYVHIETGDVMGWGDDHAATWFANRLHADYGKTKANEVGTIYLWVWW